MIWKNQATNQIFGDNLQLLYTDTDALKVSVDTIFPLEPGKNEKCFGCLKFENSEYPRKEFNAKAPKTFEEKGINELKSVKAKGLKRAFKKYISDNEFKSVTLYEKPLRIIQTNKIKKL